MDPTEEIQLPKNPKDLLWKWSHGMTCRESMGVYDPPALPHFLLNSFSTLSSIYSLAAQRGSSRVASPGSLLEMENLGPTSDQLYQNLYFNKIFRLFWNSKDGELLNYRREFLEAQLQLFTPAFILSWMALGRKALFLLFPSASSHSTLHKAVLGSVLLLCPLCPVICYPFLSPWPSLPVDKWLGRLLGSIYPPREAGNTPWRSAMAGLKGPALHLLMPDVIIPRVQRFMTCFLYFQMCGQDALVLSWQD